MARQRKTPLAWKNLTHDRRRLAVAVAGIAFAVLLMFTQVGFQNALFDSQVKVIDDLQGDVFLVSKAKFTLASEQRFPITRLYQARSCPGVAGVYPVYTDLTTSVLRHLYDGRGNEGYPIRSLGFNLEDPVFRSQEIRDQVDRLRAPATALIDRKSKVPNFDFPMDDDVALTHESAELSGKSITLVGTFELGTDFAHDGNLIMSAETFARCFPYRNRSGDPLAVVDIGVMFLREGTDPAAACDWLRAHLDRDVYAFTRQQFRDGEVEFWDKSTPIGTVFLFGKIIGFIVGMVICYQVIYSDIADHMPEFATLKAMGYTPGYFVRLITTEAVLLSLVGFLPGVAVSQLLYSGLASRTGLLLQMTPGSITFVYALTVAMCVASGLLAVRKLLSADPASLF